MDPTTEKALLERMEALELENARLRKMILILGGHLNISFEDYSDVYITPDSHSDLLRQDIIPFCDKVKELCGAGPKTEAEKQIEKILEELENTKSLKTRDVKDLLRLTYYEQATRIMKKVHDLHSDVLVLEPDAKGNTYRLRKKRILTKNNTSRQNLKHEIYTESTVCLQDVE